MHQHGPALLLTALTVRSAAMASGSVAWRVEPVEPLGDCLFVAVAVAEAYARSGAVLPYGAPGRSSLAQSLRLACNDLLCPGGVPSTEPLKGQDIPPSLLIETLPGESPRGYCKRLRQKGQWGSAAELAALAVVLDRQINVFVKDDSAAGLGAPILIQRFGVREDIDEDDGRSNGGTRIHGNGDGVGANACDHHTSRRSDLNLLFTGSSHYSVLIRKPKPPLARL